MQLVAVVMYQIITCLTAAILIRLYPLLVVIFCGGSLLLHFPRNQRWYLLAAVCGRYYCIIALLHTHHPMWAVVDMWAVVEWRPSFLIFISHFVCAKKFSTL